MPNLGTFVASLPLSQDDMAAFCANPVGYLNANDFNTSGLPAATKPLDPSDVEKLELVRELRALLKAHSIEVEEDAEGAGDGPDAPVIAAPQGIPTLATPIPLLRRGPAAPMESFATANVAEAAAQTAQIGLPFPEFETAYKERAQLFDTTKLAEAGRVAPATDEPVEPCTEVLPDASNDGAVMVRRIIGAPESGSSDLTAEAIILADDRVQVHDSSATPYNWLCRLEITAATGARWLGTGWFISPSVIVTAGHCVFLHNHGGWVRSISVFVGQNLQSYSRAFETTHFATTQGWGNDRDPIHDYGVIFAPSGNQGYFGFGYLGDTQLSGALANVTGYPQDKPSGTLWGHAKRLKPPQQDILQYEIDTFGGMSGAPVVMWDGHDYIATGIHNYGGSQLNTATRVTESVFYNFERWKGLGETP